MNHMIDSHDRCWPTDIFVRHKLLLCTKAINNYCTTFLTFMYLALCVPYFVNGKMNRKISNYSKSKLRLRIHR